MLVFLFAVVLLLFVVVVMMMIVVGLLLLLFLFASRVVGCTAAADAIRCCQVRFASPWLDSDSIRFTCCFTWRFA